jgi:cytochrome c5
MMFLACPVAALAASGEDIYTRHCAQCHSSTDVNVPQIGSAEQWKFRAGYGRKSLISSVKHGHNLMPPHGEMLKDEEIGAAIDYIAEKSGARLSQ